MIPSVSIGGTVREPLFNPALAPWRDGYLLAARRRSGNKLLVLDTDLRRSRSLGVVQLRKVQASTDVRLVPRGEGVFSLLYWDCSPRDLSITWMATRELRMLARGAPEITDPTHLRYREGGPVEKNWTPLLHGDDLLFAWTLSPLVLLRQVAASGHVALQQRVGFDDAGWCQRYGAIHGGTPFVPFGDGEQLCVFQSSTKQPAEPERNRVAYFVGAMTISRTPPWRVLRFTPEPLLGPQHALPGPCSPDSRWLTADSRVVFPCGVACAGDDVLVSCGVNDWSSVVFRLELGGLERALLPVGGGHRGP